MSSSCMLGRIRLASRVLTALLQIYWFFEFVLSALTGKAASAVLAMAGTQRQQERLARAYNKV